MIEQAMMDRLSEVVLCGLRPLRRQAPAALEKAPVKPPAVVLKSVRSNNSLSTMAPEDGDVIGDSPASQSGVATPDAADCYRCASITQSFQHSHVPKSLDFAERFNQAGLNGPPTTVMIRNIPNRYSQRELIRELESLGFAGTFDFFYAPIDTGTMGNVGYAFVNFVESAWAERCGQVLTGYTFKKHQQKARRKVATVSVAHLQGLDANIRHYEKSAVNGRTRSRRCAPIVLTGATVGAAASAAELADTWA